MRGDLRTTRPFFDGRKAKEFSSRMIVNQDNVPVLLIVDDEARILSALQRLLRREPYQLRVAGSGAEALTVLETETIDVVLSDYRMPGMDGLALMREIQARHNGVERVLMSGNADLRLVIDAVNEGHISQFVEKPWGDGALKILLSRLFLNQKLARENQELIKAVQKQNTLLLQESEKAVMGIRQKERLFATISHEIRNPLHGIQGILEILTQDRQLADSAKKLLSTAVTSAAFMRQILDDVLDYSKSEAGKMSLQEKLFLPVALVEDLVSLMQPVADSRQLSLKISYEPIIEHQHYIGDDFRIRQILNNLLSNAIKYTESGGVEITITTGPGITFSVSDTGIGIPSDKRSSLFEAFTMVDEAHDRTFGGTGLGLSIVKNLTDLMSGEISVEERTGGGSTFVVHLPLAKGQAEATTESAPDISQVIQGMQVVVADDMAANRLIVENVLSRYGASVYSFPEGDSLLTFLAETKIKPDLILLDINMPGLKGDSVLHAIRELPSMLAEVPAFAMSASLNFEGSERITQQFTGLLSKPFSVGQLLELARSYAPSQLRPASEARVPSLAPEDRRSRGHGDALEISQPEVKTPEIEALASEMGDDLVLELLEAFKASLALSIEQLDVELSTAIQVIDVAHSLKPTAFMLGMTTLADCCQRIDDLRSTERQADALEGRTELVSKIEMTGGIIERILDSLKSGAGKVS